MVRDFLHRLPQRLLGCYIGYRWLWHVLAAALTAALVLSGVDWWFFEHTRGASMLLVLVAGLGGFAMPLLATVGLYAAGKRQISIAVGQASFLGWVISSFYKVFTGRIQPEYLTHLKTIDYSHDFQFGFLQHGIFWGWPSSHAAVAVAGAVALCILWPNRAVRGAAIAWAAVVCVGAAVGFHWFSDVAAGLIVGAVAGWAVAKDIKNRRG